MLRKLFLSLPFFLCFSVAQAQPVDAPAQSGATPVVGIAHDWQLGFQEPATPVMERLTWLHDNFLLYIISAITVFVLLLALYIVLRYNRRAHPEPSKTTHNTMVEIVWTVVPVLILIVVAIPSLRLHYLMDREPEADMTVKVVGRQWYWSYEYPDHGGFGFDSYMIKDEELKPGQPRLLEVDNRLVVPVDTVVKVQMTASDVIHSWSVPAFGVKRDAVPGRLNESWFKVSREGVYYGQCSELCGVGHAFMPIAVEVVSKEKFNGWVAAQRVEAGLPAEPTADEAANPLAPASDGPQPQNIPADEAKPIAPKRDEDQPQTPTETTSPPAPVDPEDVRGAENPPGADSTRDGSIGE